VFGGVVHVFVAPGTQTPAVHVSPTVHRLLSSHDLPHVPQLVNDVFVFVSQPFFGLPSQSPNPAVQTGAHTPAEHEVVPLALAHTDPHAPQLPASVCRLISQPLTTLPSQFAKPASHVIEQAPSEHAGVPWFVLHA
jgi:hypothetical protein